MSSDKCLMTITGNASCEGKDVDRFKGHVERAMLDLVEVLREGSRDESKSKQQSKL